MAADTPFDDDALDDLLGAPGAYGRFVTMLDRTRSLARMQQRRRLRDLEAALAHHAQ
jgi:hypothetical protein